MPGKRKWKERGMIVGTDNLLFFTGLAIIACIAAFFVYRALKGVFVRVVVFDYEQGLRYHKGKFIGVLQPGMYFFVRLNDYVVKADMRPTYLTIPGQEIQSEGNVPLKISLLLQLQVVDLESAYVKTSSWQEAVHVLLQLSLRRAVSSLALDEVVKNRGELDMKLKAECMPKLAAIGIELLSVSIKDIMFSADVKKAYTQVLVAKQEGLAALEKARGETAALRNLANAAKMLENNPALYQLRLLHSLSEAKGSTVVLGTPDLLRPSPPACSRKEPNDGN